MLGKTVMTCLMLCWLMSLKLRFACNVLQIQKKKIWELVQPHLKTDDSCIGMLGEQLMQTSAGAVMSRSLKNANIS